MILDGFPLHRLRTLFAICVALFTFNTQAQKNDSYSKLWQEVEALKADGRTSTALEKTEGILAKAKKEENSPQYIKAQIHRMHFRGLKEEDAFQTSIQEMELEIEAASPPSSSVLHSALAEMYWWYYQNNRWQILQRTEEDSSGNGELETWTASRFIERIDAHYTSSLEHHDFLKETPASEYEAIWEKGESGRVFRPTLFDVLAHRALDFYSNSESGLTLPRDQFNIDNAAYFGPALEFLDMEVSEPDYVSFEYRSLQLYQEILQFHMANKNEDALAFADLSRIKYIYSKYYKSDKDELYLSALKNLLESEGNTKVRDEIIYEIALYHNRLAGRYQPGKTEMYRWQNKTAMEWCAKAGKQNPKSRGALLCEQLTKRILSPTFQVTSEAVVNLGSGIDLSVRYQNTKKIYYRIYDNGRNLIQQEASKLVIEDAQYFLSRKQMLEGAIDLPDSLDYQSHTYEVTIPELKEGYYSMVTSLHKEFKSTDNLLQTNFFSVSEMAYVYEQDDFGGAKLFVADRISGSALKGVTAVIYREEYNYKQRGRDLIEVTRVASDESGKVMLPPNSEQKNYHILLIKGGDSLMVSNPVYVRDMQKKKDRSFILSAIFTDRAVYRPGQPVYVKGIAMEKTGDAIEILPNKKLVLKLFDSNNQEVSRAELSTNEFGSYQTFFTMPSSALTGSFYLDDGASRKRILLEEYKRPSFEVTLEPISENVRLGEKITIHGKAISYNGTPLSNAQGTFNVQRYARMTIPYHYYGFLPQHKAQMDFGEFQTDEKGAFTVEFEAIPDPSLPKEYLPVFEFSVQVIVSDLNGETQTKKFSQPIGYHSLELSASLGRNVTKTDLDSLKIFSRNLSGVYTPTNVRLYLVKLNDKEEVIKEKKWNRPDYGRKDGQSEDFLYQGEDVLDRFSEGNAVLSSNVQTAEGQRISLLGGRSLESGTYLLKLVAKDPYGEEVTWEKRFALYDSNEKNLPYATRFWSVNPNQSIKVGQTASILLGSAYKDARVYYTMSNKDGVFKEGWMELKGRLNSLDIQAEEKDRGGILVQLASIHDGMITIEKYKIDVPMTNKKLRLDLETYRSDLRPGDTETWKIKVTDWNRKPVAAEVLASMYDASLDVIEPNAWSFFPHSVRIPNTYWQSGNNFSASTGRLYSFLQTEHIDIPVIRFDRLNWFGFHYGRDYLAAYAPMARSMDDGNEATSLEFDKAKNIKDLSKETSTGEGEDEEVSKEKTETDLRSDFRETGFFYPELLTNEQGEAEFSFEVPDALTRWNFQLLAHSKELKTATRREELETKKELMVVPNYPRFLTSDDSILFSAKVSNLTNGGIEADVRIEIADPITGKPRPSLLLEKSAKKIEVKAEQNAGVSWWIKAPSESGMLRITVYAATDKHRDAESRMVPVLSRSVLVTESDAINLRAGQSRKVNIGGLEKFTNTIGLRPHRLTVEFTPNPAWYVVQALPYLAEIGTESVDQVFNRLYANSIANWIANSNDRIEEVFKLWKQGDGNAFRSQLEKNPELRNIVLSETPWLLEAQGESADKKKIAAFFDHNNIRTSLSDALFELMQSQTPNGGWPWFKGMEDNRYITQYIVTGLARLDHLGINDIRNDQKIWKRVEKAIEYLDNRINEDYLHLKAHSKNLEEVQPGARHIQYLFMRSYLSEIAVQEENKEAVEYFKRQTEKYWLNQNKYLQAMIALTSNRDDNYLLSAKILTSLRENAIHSDEFGTYWKKESGYSWFQADIEKQAMIIEAFEEIAGDRKEVDEMKIWLLKQKQTHRWRTGRATAEACYALLLRGSDLLSSVNTIELAVGDESFVLPAPGTKSEAGTGYTKMTWEKSEIRPDMKNIVAENKGESLSWGAAYFQYFQNSDEVESSASGLSVSREYYIKRHTAAGDKLVKVDQNNVAEVGDIVVVKLILKSDRDLEFVHLKDLRPAGLEPVDVRSGYQWKGGMGYYLSIRDVATHFYFGRMNRGTYVLEYESKANNAGVFTGGMASFQCYYAPEFNANSNGQRLEITAH